jgi:outer membrane protein OmpA-like peptidoglycan-associated protein
MKIQNKTLLALPLAAVMALPAAAQSNSGQSTSDTQKQVDTQQQQQTNPEIQTGISSNSSATATAEHQPLELQSKEGFWGKLNPFARKKYVKRQMAPVIGRVNELDELTAANAHNIKDVDSRATEGLRLANLKVNEADSHAVEATNRANLAHETATQANTRIESVQSALQNVDKYESVTEAEIRFRPGQTLLSNKAKTALDEIAQSMKDQKGMIVEVQGFSSGAGSASVENSQRMAQSVVRYLVVNHEIPVYRIYTVGMGNAPVKTADGKNRRLTGGRVEVSLLKNGIGDLNAQMSQQGAMPEQNAAPATQPATTTPANNTTGYGVNTNTNLPQSDRTPDQAAQKPEKQAPQQQQQEKPEQPK